MFRLLFGMLLLAGFAACGQVLDIRGRVTGARETEPLPFVNVIVVGTTHGTVTDVEGRFHLPVAAGQSLEFRYVGYQSVVQPVTRPGFLAIRMKEEPTTLSAVTIRPGDNPALRIIRKVIDHRSEHDPMQMTSWSYQSYNKLSCALELVGSTRSLGKDSASLRNFVNRYQAFVSESYTEKKYIRPNQHKEVVLGNRLTGVKDPFFAFLGTDFQPFGFYDEVIPLMGVNYVSPISKAGLQGYDYTLMDTIRRGADSTYIVSFEPLPGKTFAAMKGQLYVSTDGYALEYVLASPADEHQLMETRIQQQYARQDGHWFPAMLNSEIIFNEYNVRGIRPHYFSRTYLTAVQVGKPVALDRRDLLNVSFDEGANRRPEEFWRSHRLDSATAKERSTFRLYDSLAPQLRVMNGMMKILEGAMVGKFKAGKFYLPLEHLVKVNQYEGLRLGIGLETGESISRWLALGGYAGYGFKDRALKYGGMVSVHLSRARETALTFTAVQDLLEPGNPNFLRPAGLAAGPENLRSWMASRMDSLRQMEAAFSFRPARFTQLRAYARSAHRRSNYPYFFAGSPPAVETTLRQEFVTAEVGLQLRYAFGEQHMQIGNNRVVTKQASPQVRWSAARAVSGWWDGQFDFWKTEVSAQAQHNIRRMGRLSWQLDAGWLQTGQALPWPLLFNGKGSLYPGAFQQGFIISNYFQTMGLYEFASDRYAYLFLQHQVGRITSTRWSWFRPELSLVQNIGFGSLQHPEAHRRLDFKTMEKGYFESGLMLTNVIRLKYLNLLYYGLGGGVFYRTGAYQLPTPSSNLAWKLMVTVSF